MLVESVQAEVNYLRSKPGGRTVHEVASLVAAINNELKYYSHDGVVDPSRVQRINHLLGELQKLI